MPPRLQHVFVSAILNTAALLLTVTIDCRGTSDCMHEHRGVAVIAGLTFLGCIVVLP